MGRPPVPAHLKRDKRLVVMLTDDEAENLSRAAQRDKSASLSDWIRETLLTEISKANETVMLRAQAAEFWLQEIVRCVGLSAEATISHIDRMLEWAKEESSSKPAWVSGPFVWNAEMRYPFVEEVAIELKNKIRAALD